MIVGSRGPTGPIGPQGPVGPSFLYSNVLWVDGVNGADANNGGIGAPKKTIQAALTAIGDSASVADLKTPKTVMITPGIYDEDLTIPRGRIITLCAMGTVILGNGAAATLGSTNTRNITANWFTADLLGSSVIRPCLTLTVLGGGSDATSTFVAMAGGWNISGNLVINGDGQTGSLNTTGVKVNGTFTFTSAGLCNWQSYRSLYVGAVTTTGNLVLERAYDSRFNALCSVNAINMATGCNFLAGITVQSIQQNMVPNGFFHTNIAGTFTGPALSARFDAATNYYFKANAAVLGGSASKVILGDLTA